MKKQLLGVTDTGIDVTLTGIDVTDTGCRCDGYRVNLCVSVTDTGKVCHLQDKISHQRWLGVVVSGNYFIELYT